MQAELRSCELLVWIACAMVFTAVRHKYPKTMMDHGVCLCPNDLRHLVLSEKIAVDAALKLAEFLRRHTRQSRAVFSLLDGGNATFAMVFQARIVTALSTIWKTSRRLQEHVGKAMVEGQAEGGKMCRVTIFHICVEIDSSLCNGGEAGSWRVVRYEQTLIRWLLL